MKPIISTISRSLFSPETPMTQRCGYPKMNNKIKELRERYGMVSSWTAMPLDKQLELYHELSAYYDSLVFYDKVSCYTYFAYEKAYRTGYYAMQKMKEKSKKNPDICPFTLLRPRCMPVSAPPIPDVSHNRQIEIIFSDKMYRMTRMELLMDAYELKIGKAQYGRALFPVKPFTELDYDRRKDTQAEVYNEECIEEEVEDQEALEETHMELLRLTSRRSMIASVKEEHHLSVESRPPRSLEDKANAFFAPSEVVVNPPSRAQFVSSSTSENESNTSQKANYMDKQLALSRQEIKKVTAFIPAGFHILAKRYNYVTWDVFGIYYPRNSYTILSFFMNRKQPPSPLSPGASAPNGVVHIPWKLHHDAWNGNRDSIHEIILHTSIN